MNTETTNSAPTATNIAALEAEIKRLKQLAKDAHATHREVVVFDSGFIGVKVGNFHYNVQGAPEQFKAVFEMREQIEAAYPLAEQKYVASKAAKEAKKAKK